MEATAVSRRAARSSVRSRATVVDVSLYSLLNVEPSASTEEIKGAYRRLAKQYHPDVSEDPEASSRFSAIASAYDVLSDATSRGLYDTQGLEGLRMDGHDAGRGNAAASWAEMGWSEFNGLQKPRRRSRKERAREASEAQGTSATDQHGIAVGQLVEYPLRSADQTESRQRGLGLLVSRNFDRADAFKLTPSLLGLCEVEPLTLSADARRWMKDAEEPSAFAHMDALLAVPAAFESSKARGRGLEDAWTLRAELSEGCSALDGGHGDSVIASAAPQASFFHTVSVDEAEARVLYADRRGVGMARARGDDSADGSADEGGAEDISFV